VLLCLAVAGAGYVTVFRDPPPNHRLAATSIAAPTVELSEGNWITFLGDAARSNVADAGPIERPGELWRVQAGGSCDAPPVASGGAIYEACGDGILYALDAATGSERWRYTISRPWTRLAMAGGLVYSVDNAGTLYAIDRATGIERWTLAISASTDLAIEDGLLVVGTADGFLIGLDAATSQERWRTQIGESRSAHTPAIAGGIVFASSENGGLVAVDGASGALRWRADIGTDSSSTARVINGVVYLGAGSTGYGRLRAFDADSGALLWANDLQLGGLTVSGDLGFAGGDGHFYALDIDTGEVRWEVPVSGQTRGGIVAGDLVYVFGDGDQRLYAFEVETGRERWSYDLQEANNSTFSIAGGVIYIGTGFGGIVALGETDSTSSSAGADTPTP
jgi:outer membrane protein assembly factor BamB